MLKQLWQKMLEICVKILDSPFDLPHFASVEGYEIIGVEQVHKTGKSLVFVVDREEVLYQ
jgi:hypothetical protein